MKFLLENLKFLSRPFVKRKKTLNLRKGNEERLHIQRKIGISILGIAIFIAFYWFLYTMSWSGFGPESNKSKSVEQTTLNGKIIGVKETETEYFQSPKTLWDWLELAGVVAIPIVLFQFSRMEQQRAEKLADADKEKIEKQAEVEKEIAASKLREDALESYIDRISELLIDKNLSAQSLDKSVRDVARIRTVTVLRRLEKDVERRGRVIHFLRDARLLEFILKDTVLNAIDFSDADLTQANLSGANLSGVNFSRAILRNANLHDANLSNSKLHSTDLLGADLTDCNLFQAEIYNVKNCDETEDSECISVTPNWVDFSRAKLINSIVKESNLDGACFEGAELSFSEFKDVSLRTANLKNVSFKTEFFVPKGQGTINLRQNFSISLTGWQNVTRIEGKAKLTGVNLNDAILDLADFSGAVFVEPISFQRVRYSNQDVVPTFSKDFDISKIELVLND